MIAAELEERGRGQAAVGLYSVRGGELGRVLRLRRRESEEAAAGAGLPELAAGRMG